MPEPSCYTVTLFVIVQRDVRLCRPSLQSWPSTVFVCISSLRMLTRRPRCPINNNHNVVTIVVVVAADDRPVTTRRPWRAPTRIKHLIIIIIVIVVLDTMPPGRALAAPHRLCHHSFGCIQ